jgi:drug/metabolite transporter (DMT)-like permease
MVKNFVTMITFSAKTWAFQNIPLGDASALIFTMPLWTGIFSRIFLKEKYTIAQLFCTIVGFSGVILVAKPTFLFPSEKAVISEKEQNPGWYPLIALLSGVSMATEFTMQKGLGDTISSMVITFYMMVFHVAAGLILHHAMGDVYLNPSCHLSRGLLIIASLHPVIGLSCLMQGLRVESASISTLVKNLDTVLAFIVQVTVFGDPIDGLSIGGAALIIAGTITLTLTRMFNITCGIEL